MSESEVSLPNLPFEINIPYAPDKKLIFENPMAVKEWAEREKDAFTNVAPPKRVPNDYWSKHLRKIDGVIKSSDVLIKYLRGAHGEGSLDSVLQDIPTQFDHDIRNLNTQLVEFGNGNFITTFHPNFPLVSHFAKLQQFEVARAVINASTGPGLLGQHQPAVTNDTQLLVNALLHLLSRSTEDNFHLQRWDTEFHALHAQFSKSNADNADLREQLEDAFMKHRHEYDADKTSRDKEWGDHQIQVKAELSSHREKVENDWNTLKGFYDNQLAVAAPTQYWKDRSTMHHSSTKKFAIAFSVAVVGSIASFIYWGIPYLKDIPAVEGQSAIVSVLPVLVPAFGLIWILRILARQLSENMTLTQDAKERVTMVMTFIALMKDETTGKSVITDADRILILHSLFRPSAVTAADDSPPLSILERVVPKSK